MKLKRILSLLAATAMMVTALTSAMSVSVVSAADDYPTSGKCGDNIDWLINSDGVLVISGNGEIKRPTDNWGWAKLNKDVKEVVIENGITSTSADSSAEPFGRNYCTSISKITFPPSFLKLSRTLETVKFLENLKDIYIYSKNVTDTSYQADHYPGGIIWHVYEGSDTEKSLLNDLKLSDKDIEYIPDDEQMPTVNNKTPAEFDEQVTETSGPSGLFSKYEWNETSKTLTFSGKGAISMADYYKNYAEETEHIVIKSGITVINSNTGIGNIKIELCGSFTGFTALKDVQLPDGIVVMPACAFKNDANLEEINIPNSLNVIGEAAFSYCSKLKSINLREGMKIGGNAFHVCKSLKEVTIPKNCYLENTFETGGAGMARGACTFEDCTGLEKVVIEDGSKLDNAFFSGFLSQNGIPEGFCRGCTSLKTVIIRGNIDYIGLGAFNNCTSLTDIYFYNTGLNTITAKNADANKKSIEYSNNPTFHVVKGSQTEETLKDAGYLTDENTVYIADTTALETAISEAEAIETDKYTDESVSALTKAIENAKTILENYDATQDEVDNAVKAIEDAKNALAEKPDEPSTDNSSDPSNSSGNNNQSQSPNTPATPPTSAPTTATPKPTTPPAVTTTVTKPAKVKNVKVTAKKKKLNVSWKKVSGATGYEVLSATNNKFTKNKKTVTVKKNKVTLKRLKSKKKYFVKVRAYKLANGNKYFGKWSKVVKKKVK